MKILHTSDWHVDGGHGYGNPEESFRRRVALIDGIIETALGEKAQLVLHTGDLTDTPHPSTRTVRELQRLVRKLADAGIHFVDVAGNHESHKASAAPTVGQLLEEVSPEFVHIVTRPMIQVIEGVQLACMPWVHRSQIQADERFKNLPLREVAGEMNRMAVEMIESMIAQADPKLPLICAAHATVIGATTGAEIPVSDSANFTLPHHAFASEKVSYAALGHIHKHQQVGEPWIVYAGSPDRVTFGEKDEPKGYVIVEPQAGKRAKWEFVETDARKFAEVIIEKEDGEIVLDCDDIDTNISIGAEKTHDLIYPDLFDGYIVKIKLCGTKQEVDSIDIAAIEKSMSASGAFAYQIIREVTQSDRQTRIENAEGLSMADALGLWADGRCPKEKEALIAVAGVLSSAEIIPPIRADAAGLVPVKLELKNFCSHAETILDFERFDMAAIAGENGAGKSSLIEAIGWAVWGYSRAASDDELVAKGAEDLAVSFSFRIGDDLYSITRKRSIKSRRSTGSLELTRGQEVLTGKDMRATQEIITATIGMTAEVFFTSAYLRQGHAGDFTGAKPSERKAVLAEILSLREWEQLETAAKERRKQAHDHLLVFEGKASSLDAELAKETEYTERLQTAETTENDARKALADAERAVGDIEAEIETLSAAVAAATADKVRREEYARRIAKGKAELAELETERFRHNRRKEELKGVIEAEKDALQAKDRLPQLQRHVDDLQRLRDRYMAATSEKEKCELRQKHLTNHLSALDRRKLENMAEGKAKKEALMKAGADCPACGAGKEHQKHDPRAAAETELTRLREQYRQLEAEMSTARTELDAIVIPEVPLFSETMLTSALADLQGTREIAAIALQVEAARQELLRLEEEEGRLIRRECEVPGELSDAERRLQELGDDAGSEALAKKEILVKEREARKAKAENLRTSLTQASGLLAVARNQLAELAKKAKELQALKEENAVHLKEQALMELLAEAASKKGAPALIIEAALPELEESANVILSRISGNSLTVRFATLREKKSASLKDIFAGENSQTETLDIFVAQNGEERELATFSGGERFRVNFAIRVALARLLARRSGVQCRTLFIDEGGSELDSEGKAAFLAAVREISGDFAKVLVISHIPEIIEGFETVIQVEKRGGISGLSFL